MTEVLEKIEVQRDSEFQKNEIVERGCLEKGVVRSGAVSIGNE